MRPGVSLQAKTFIVDYDQDIIADDGFLSLREAMDSVALRVQNSLECLNDSITFSTEMTIALSSPIDIIVDTLYIFGDIDLDGNRDISLTSANASINLLTIRPKYLNFDGFTISDAGSSSNGPAIFFFGSTNNTVSVNNCSFFGNREIGALQISGLTAMVTNCQFLANRSNSEIHSACITLNGSSATIENVMFDFNFKSVNAFLRDVNGGVAVWVDGSQQLNINRCSFNRSVCEGSSVHQGVSIFAERSRVTIENSVFTRSETSAEIIEVPSSSDGSVIWSDEPTIIRHSTITDNENPAITADIELSHTILNNSSDTINIFGAGASLTSNGYNLFSNSNVIGSDSTDILGVIPVFSGTYVPLTNSVVIDAGNPSIVNSPIVDTDGQPRISNGIIDIGAFETQITCPDCIINSTNTWLGGIGSWHTAESWSRGVVPLECDEVAINSGMVTIESERDASCFSLNVAHGAELIQEVFSNFTVGCEIIE